MSIIQVSPQLDQSVNLLAHDAGNAGGGTGAQGDQITNLGLQRALKRALEPVMAELKDVKKQV